MKDTEQVENAERELNKTNMKWWKKILILLAISIIGLYFLGLGLHMAYGEYQTSPMVIMEDCECEERDWYSFKMDEEKCIEVYAIDFNHARCVIEVVAEEKGYKTAEVIEYCPGILADDYYYDFSFEECK